MVVDRFSKCQWRTKDGKINYGGDFYDDRQICLALLQLHTTPFCVGKDFVILYRSFASLICLYMLISVTRYYNWLSSNKSNQSFPICLLRQFGSRWLYEAQLRQPPSYTFRRVQPSSALCDSKHVWLQASSVVTKSLSSYKTTSLALASVTSEWAVPYFLDCILSTQTLTKGTGDVTGTAVESESYAIKHILQPLFKSLVHLLYNITPKIKGNRQILVVPRETALRGLRNSAWPN